MRGGPDLTHTNQHSDTVTHCLDPTRAPFLGRRFGGVIYAVYAAAVYAATVVHRLLMLARVDGVPGETCRLGIVTRPYWFTSTGFPRSRCRSPSSRNGLNFVEAWTGMSSSPRCISFYLTISHLVAVPTSIRSSQQSFIWAQETLGVTP